MYHLPSLEGKTPSQESSHTTAGTPRCNSSLTVGFPCMPGSPIVIIILGMWGEKHITVKSRCAELRENFCRPKKIKSKSLGDSKSFGLWPDAMSQSNEIEEHGIAKQVLPLLLGPTQNKIDSVENAFNVSVQSPSFFPFSAQICFTRDTPGRAGFI